MTQNIPKRKCKVCGGTRWSVSTYQKRGNPRADGSLNPNFYPHTSYQCTACACRKFTAKWTGTQANKDRNNRAIAVRNEKMAKSPRLKKKIQKYRREWGRYLTAKLTDGYIRKLICSSYNLRVGTKTRLYARDVTQQQVTVKRKELKRKRKHRMK